MVSNFLNSGPLRWEEIVPKVKNERVKVALVDPMGNEVWRGMALATTAGYIPENFPPELRDSINFENISILEWDATPQGMKWHWERLPINS